MFTKALVAATALASAGCQRSWRESRPVTSQEEIVAKEMALTFMAKLEVKDVSVTYDTMREVAYFPNSKQTKLSVDIKGNGWRGRARMVLENKHVFDFLRNGPGSESGAKRKYSGAELMSPSLRSRVMEKALRIRNRFSDDTLQGLSVKQIGYEGVPLFVYTWSGSYKGFPAPLQNLSISLDPAGRLYGFTYNRPGYTKTGKLMAREAARPLAEKALAEFQKGRPKIRQQERITKQRLQDTMWVLANYRHKTAVATSARDVQQFFAFNSAAPLRLAHVFSLSGQVVYIDASDGTCLGGQFLHTDWAKFQTDTMPRRK